jgi:hypothetical protein
MCTVFIAGRFPDKCEVYLLTGESILVLNNMRPFSVAENVASFGYRFSYSSE